MIKTWLAGLILLTLISLYACNPPAAPETATVTHVIDGDTFVIDTGHKVRYIGIDTPEVYPEMEPYGAKAQQVNRELVAGKKVRLERDISETDSYGRLLRYVYVDGLFVNAELVRRGLAIARAYPPDIKYQEILIETEEEAYRAGRGIWAQ